MKVCIIGGGISGLSLGYYILRGAKLNGCHVDLTIIEKEKQIGGLVSTKRLAGVELESTYHLFFPNDDHLMDLIKEMGLWDRFKWFPSKGVSYLTNNGKSYLSGPKDVLLARNLSIIDKAALGRIYIEMKLRKNWKVLDNIDAKSWVLRHGTRRLYGHFFEPLLSIKWGESKEDVSAAWLWGRINPRSKTRNASGGGEKMAYLLGSLQRLIDRLIEEIEEMGGKILLNSEVSKISFGPEGVKDIIVKREESFSQIFADVFVTTTAPTEMIGVADNLPDRLKRLQDIKYAKIVCAGFALKKPLIDTIQMPISRDGFCCGGVFEITNCVPPEYFGGHHIVYLFNYLDSFSELFSKPDEDILKLYKRDIRKINPSIEDKDIVDYFVYRNRRGTPVYEVGYLNLMPPQKYQNLFFHGMAMAYPVSDMNNLIGLSKRLAKRVIKEGI